MTMMRQRAVPIPLGLGPLAGTRLRNLKNTISGSLHVPLEEGSLSINDRLLSIRHSRESGNQKCTVT
jgi:hypothetical protein